MRGLRESVRSLVDPAPRHQFVLADEEVRRPRLAAGDAGQPVGRVFQEHDHEAVVAEDVGDAAERHGCVESLAEKLSRPASLVGLVFGMDTRQVGDAEVGGLSGGRGQLSASQKENHFHGSWAFPRQDLMWFSACPRRQ